MSTVTAADPGKSFDSPVAPTRYRRPVAAILVIATLAILVWAHVEAAPFAEDDAFIHLRIASHLVDHGQPYFNLDEPVKGSSSTAWLLVTAATTVTSSDPVTALAVLNALFLLIAASLAARIGMELLAGPSRCLPVASAVLTAMILWPSSLRLMETVLAVMLFLAAYLALIRNKQVAWFMLGLAIAVRIEFAIALIPALYAWMRTDNRSLRQWASSVAIGLGALLPFVIFDLVNYGTFVPHAAIAKSQLYSPTSAESLSMMVPTFGTWGAVPYFAAALLVLGLPWRTDDRRALWSQSLILTGLLIGSAYIATRTFVFPWYQSLYLVPLALGALWKAVLSRQRGSGFAALFLALPLLAYSLVISLVAFGAISSPIGSLHARTETYIAVGNALQTACPTCNLMSSEIGGLGWGFSGTVIDAGGLTDPEALGYHPMEVPSQRASGLIGSIPWGFVELRRPDFIVSYEVFLENGMLQGIAGYDMLKCDPLLARHLEAGHPPVVFSSDALYLLISEGLPRSTRVASKTQLQATISCEVWKPDATDT